MNVDSIEKTLNQTIQSFAVQLEHFIGVAIKTGIQLQNEFIEITRSLSSPIEFTALQKTLLKVLLILLAGTAFFIAYSWRVYGKVITEKFVRPSEYQQFFKLEIQILTANFRYFKRN